MMNLSICVLHYNRWDLTKDCLASIDAQHPPNSCEKLLCDNCSDTIPESIPKGWTYLRSLTQRGNIGGQNFCFEQASRTWVLFVANDVRFKSIYDSEVVSNLYGATAHANYRKLGQLQPVCERPDGTLDQAGLAWRWPGYGVSLTDIRTQREIPCVASTCYLMRKAVWKELGGFDERLISSHEDIEMGLRLKQAGYVNLLVPHVHVTHLINQTLKHTIHTPRRNFHRDRVYVIKKHSRGVARLVRLALVHLLDSFPRW